MGAMGDGMDGGGMGRATDMMEGGRMEMVAKWAQSRRRQMNRCSIEWRPMEQCLMEHAFAKRAHLAVCDLPGDDDGMQIGGTEILDSMPRRFPPATRG